MQTGGPVQYHRPPLSKPKSRFNSGTLIIPAATAVAVFLIPASTRSPGDLLIPAWVQTVGFVAAIFFDVVEHGMRRFFHASNMLLVAMFVIVYPEPLQPGYFSSLLSDSVATTFIAIGTFGTMICIGASCKSPKLPGGIVTMARGQYSRSALFRIMLLCTVVGMLNFVISSGFSLSSMLHGLFASRWSAPWARGQMGGWDAFRDFLSYFGYIVPSLTVLLALRWGSWIRFEVFIGLLSSVVLLLFLAQGGGRRIVVVVVGAAVLTWLSSKKGRLRALHWLSLACVTVLTIVVLNFMLLHRTYGIATPFRPVNIPDSENVHVDDNFRSLGETLRIIPRETDFVGFQYLTYVLVRPIPRVFWEEKPVSPGFDLAEHLHQPGLLISITAIGEMYAGFGWIGIVAAGFFFGWLARYWTQLLDQDFGMNGIALYGLGAMALFLGMRSLLELLLMSYPILCWFVLDRFFRDRPTSQTYRRILRF